VFGLSSATSKQICSRGRPSTSFRSSSPIKEFQRRSHRLVDAYASNRHLQLRLDEQKSRFLSSPERLLWPPEQAPVDRFPQNVTLNRFHYVGARLESVG
jgi:hypothetical protein